HAGNWSATAAPQDELTALDFAGGSAWGIDATGALVHYDGARWSRWDVAGGPLAGTSGSSLTDGSGGWSALAFRDAGEGYAAGAGGALARFDGSRWTLESS